MSETEQDLDVVGNKTDTGLLPAHGGSINQNLPEVGSMNLTEREMYDLLQAEAEKDDEKWNAACDEIKRVRGGIYPPDWFSRVLQPRMNGWLRVKITTE